MCVLDRKFHPPVITAIRGAPPFFEGDKMLLFGREKRERYHFNPLFVWKLVDSFVRMCDVTIVVSFNDLLAWNGATQCSGTPPGFR